MVVIIINAQLRPVLCTENAEAVHRLLALLSLDHYNAVQCSTTSAILCNAVHL